MKILLISMLFYPESRIGAVRPTNFARYLAEFGHQVDVLTTEHQTERVIPGVQIHSVSYGPLVKRLNDKLQRRFDRKTKGNRNNSQLPQKLQNKNKKFHTGILLRLDHIRGRDWMRRCKKFFRKNVIGQYDVIISSYGPIGTYWTGRAAKKRGIAPYWICDLRDRMPNKRYPGWFNVLYKRYERAALREADAIILVSEGQRKTFLEDYRIQGNERLRVIYNGYEKPDLKQVYPAHDDRVLRLCYTGFLYGRQAAAAMFFKALGECLGKINSDRMELHYAGPDGRVFKELADGMDFKLIDYGLVPREQALRIQRSSDILVAFSWNEQDQQGILSGKFLEYIALQKPIISVVTGSLPDAEITLLVRRHKLGVACEEAGGREDVDRLKDFLLMQYRRRQRGEPLIVTAEGAERFDYDNLTRLLESVCKEVTQDEGSSIP